MLLDIETAPTNVGPPITVEASDNLFEELGNNTYDYKDLLSELIDNSLAARNSVGRVHITITLGLSEVDPLSNKLVISDDAQGIPFPLIGNAISPAAVQTKNSLNEHGLGMKQAIAGLGSLDYLATKTKDDKSATIVEFFRFGQIFPKQLEVEWESGTEIAIGKLKPIVRTHTVSYTRDLVPYLGARYRRFLAPDHPMAEMKIRIVDLDDDNKLVSTWDVTEVKPVYFHPNTRKNAPVITNKIFKAMWL